LKDNLRKIISKLKSSPYEYYILTLISLGIPLVAFLYFDYRAAILSFVIIQSVIGLLAIKNESEAASDDSN